MARLKLFAKYKLFRSTYKIIRLKLKLQVTFSYLNYPEYRRLNHLCIYSLKHNTKNMFSLNKLTEKNKCMQ